MKVNVDPCACVWGGTDFPANIPVWSSRKVPFIGDRLGKTGVPRLERLCRGLQGQGEAQHWSWEKQGEGRAIIHDCCCTQKGGGDGSACCPQAMARKLCWLSKQVIAECRLLPGVHSPAHRTILHETSGSAAPEAMSCPRLPCAEQMGRETSFLPSQAPAPVSGLQFGLHSWRLPFRLCPRLKLGFAAQLFSRGNQIPLKLRAGKALLLLRRSRYSSAEDCGRGSRGGVTGLTAESSANLT